MTRARNTSERPLDTTAGVTATRTREDPGAPQPVTDPTDPRYGQMLPRRTERRHVTDPTDSGDDVAA